MKKQILSKPDILEKLKKGSKWIAVLCILAVLLNLLEAVLEATSLKSYTDLAIAEYTILRRMISCVLSAVIMGIAALLFIRITREGTPFTAKNVCAVRIIGILFLLNALIPTAVAAGRSQDCTDLFTLSNPPALIEGLLFLFIAHIIRYGAMLQQESDETL